MWGQPTDSYYRAVLTNYNANNIKCYTDSSGMWPFWPAVCQLKVTVSYAKILIKIRI